METGLPVKVCDPQGRDFPGEYLLYLSGWTEERYFVEAPDMWFVEFVDGELIVHSPVSIRHQAITIFLTTLLNGYVDTNKLGMVLSGPAVTRLRPGMDYEPDIFFVEVDQMHLLERQYFSGAPGLVVEVISPSTRNYDLRVKAANYHRHGVLEYWAIDPDNHRLFHHLAAPGLAGEYTVTEVSSGRLESAAVPGFWIDVSWLWADPLPGAVECLRQLTDI